MCLHRDRDHMWDLLAAGVACLLGLASSSCGASMEHWNALPRSERDVYLLCVPYVEQNDANGRCRSAAGGRPSSSCINGVRNHWASLPTPERRRRWLSQFGCPGPVIDRGAQAASEPSHCGALSTVPRKSSRRSRCPRSYAAMAGPAMSS